MFKAWLQARAKAAAKALGHFLSRLLPGRDEVLISCFPDFEDTLRALIDESFLPGRPKFALVDAPEAAPEWVRTSRVVLVRRASFKALLKIACSNYIFYTHGLLFYPQSRRDRLLVNVWHGMPLKKIGLDDPKAGPVPAFDMTVATSSAFQKVVAGCFGAPLTRVQVIGLPRNEMLLRAPSQRAKASFIQGRSRLLVWLPTFRVSVKGSIRTDGVEGDTPLGLKMSDVVVLNEALAQANAQLVVKPHPMSLHAGAEFPALSNISIVSDRLLWSESSSLYELLACSDALITDYSSAYVDYLLLNRPIIFYIPDKVQYIASRGLYFEIDETSFPGTLCESPDALLGAIKAFALDPVDTRMLEARALAKSRFHDVEDGFVQRLSLESAKRKVQ